MEITYEESVYLRHVFSQAYTEGFNAGLNAPPETMPKELPTPPPGFRGFTLTRDILDAIDLYNKEALN